MKLLDENLTGFIYCEEFKEIMERKLVDFDPWVILEGDYLNSRYEGLKKRYPSRQLIPFARRLDNDDLACWSLGNNQKVLIIHDYASDGWEYRNSYDNFWDWFRSVVEDMISFIGVG